VKVIVFMTILLEKILQKCIYIAVFVRIYEALMSTFNAFSFPSLPNV